MSNATRRTNPGGHAHGKVSGVKFSETKKQPVKTKSKTVIKSKEAYELTLQEVDALMKRGENNLSTRELERLSILASAAEQYEDTHNPLPLPDSLPDIIRMRMFQMRLNQGFIAKLLGISDAKFSLIMNGKQKPDIYFIKAIHQKLHVDGNRLLQAL
jgi:HTH-type transcriptional regulator/antitoxin HigA